MRVSPFPMRSLPRPLNRWSCFVPNFSSFTCYLGASATTTATATRTSLQKWIRVTSNVSALIPSRLIRQMLAIFLELNSNGLYQSSGKEKESCCLVFPSSTKREIRHFHVAPATTANKCIQKSVMHVQSCCFANINLLLLLLYYFAKPVQHHAKDPYIKVDHNTGVYDPYSLRTVCGFFNVPQY